MRASTKTIALALIVTAAGFSGPASAGGLFESLFGGFRRAVREVPAAVSSFADPFQGMRGGQGETRTAEYSPSSGYCVRTCDGHFFPVRATAGVSAAQLCSSFCPATETKVYSGGGSIDNSVTKDGSRYSDLPNAFLYRQKLVSNCTCNGKTTFGLANIDVKTDPTLKQGDIVATAGGLSAYSGANNKLAEFTPISNYRSLPPNLRDRLAETKVAPENAMAQAPVPLRGKEKQEAKDVKQDAAPERIVERPARSYNARWSND
ncbi:MAG: DUF2865 domain-containing protein [Pseudolabrys sp.]|nr:DUF2865 domain-containing protein [Pseudolabrys sp.]